jgi:hypothetical protein
VPIARVDQQQAGQRWIGSKETNGGDNEPAQADFHRLLMPIDQLSTLSILLTVEICYSVAQSIRRSAGGGVRLKTCLSMDDGSVVDR